MFEKVRYLLAEMTASKYYKISKVKFDEHWARYEKLKKLVVEQAKILAQAKSIINNNIIDLELESKKELDLLKKENELLKQKLKIEKSKSEEISSLLLKKIEELLQEASSSKKLKVYDELNRKLSDLNFGDSEKETSESPIKDCIIDIEEKDIDDADENNDINFDVIEKDIAELKTLLDIKG